MDVTGGREDAIVGEPRVLYVEIKDGTASVPDGVEDWPWMVEGADDGVDIELDDVADPEDTETYYPPPCRAGVMPFLIISATRPEV